MHELEGVEILSPNSVVYNLSNINVDENKCTVTGEKSNYRDDKYPLDIIIKALKDNWKVIKKSNIDLDKINELYSELDTIL